LGEQSASIFNMLIMVQSPLGLCSTSTYFLVSVRVLASSPKEKCGGSGEGQHLNLLQRQRIEAYTVWHDMLPYVGMPLFQPRVDSLYPPSSVSDKEYTRQD